jgi:beta-lactamase class D
MKYLGIKEITTQRQKDNGTREFVLPFYVRGELVTIASYKKGYIRVDRNCHSRYQINPTYEVPYKLVGVDGVLREWKNKKRMMIYSEESRINFIFNYALKNYFNKYKKWETIN